MAKAAAKPKAPQDLVEIFDDFEQGDPEWFQVRLGLPTASNFATIMRSGKDGGESKTRDELLRKLAGERLCGEPSENYQNAAMQRGKDMEAEARDLYARRSFAKLSRVAFVKRTIVRPVGPPLVIGCSPDALIGVDGALEIKTLAPHLLIAQALRGTLPPEHRPQCHGTLWVLGRKWIDLQLFYRGMPVAPKFKIERDETYIREIADAVEVFDYELRQMVDRIRKMGGAG